ncbi:COMM domain-containing protein 2-like [Neodiprion pinetum]|uniref:COMM domain-containing protein 2 n=1 Tax=Neodiprion lecontei TaxID=441921 RepID=A0A6J0B7M4_NEOLC|nr:COMM domain-containing protein 2 [Neodiprion lecontei]XP_046469414.1 COMM domain-containing protein 2-like [Neodiprion pinetum]XP_046607211.1 COMM domain-containing protein 2-like [Neodiprion virginianus]
MLTLKSEHKKHIHFLVEQSTNVLQDFCKLGLDYLHNGPNFKLYNVAAQKLDIQPEDVRCTVEGLINLLLESCKCKLSTSDFRDSIIALGFSEDHEVLLTKLYTTKQSEISEILPTLGVKLQEYQSMEWRFETQISSRSLLSQVTPLVVLDFSLRNNVQQKIEHVIVQTDANNLLHITEELEQALQDGRSQHLRKIARSIR